MLGTNPTISNVDSAPHALRDNGTADNGIFLRAASSAFPTSTNNAANYYVDPVFTPQSFTTPPGQVGNVNATAGYASATVTWSAPTAGDPATAYTITPYIGSTAQTSTTVPGNPAPTTATLRARHDGTRSRSPPRIPRKRGPESANSTAVTPSSSALHVDNSGFESGLASWTTGGSVTPTASSAQVHSGNGSSLLGVVQPAPTPGGDSSVSQTVSIPPTGTTTLTFWYRPSTTDEICSGTACQFDWEEQQVQNTSGQTLASIFKSNSNSSTWTKVTYDMSQFAGQNVVLWFNVHNDQSANPDDSWMYVDDVALTQPTPPGAPTGVAATAGNGQANGEADRPLRQRRERHHQVHRDALHRLDGADPGDSHRQPPGDIDHRQRVDERDHVHVQVSATTANGTGPDSSPSKP